MAKLMLVNPAKRRKARKPRSAAQKAATKRMLASRKTNPVKRPKNRVTATKRRIRRRKNPMGRGIINSTLVPSAQGAAGALALDVLLAYVPLPATMKTGPLGYVAKGVGALGMGMLASMVVKKSTAESMTRGAMTVLMRDIGKQLASTLGVPIAGLGYYSAGTPMGVGEYVNGMAAYVGSGGANTYLSNQNLSTPFAGPSAAATAHEAARAATESENNMGSYY